MTPWTLRSHEERSLLNPAFCATLVWQAASGYSEKSDIGMSFEESFLVLPFVLHRETREILPRTTRTSLAVWFQEHPLARGNVARRAQAMVPFTKEALTFGGMHGFFQLNGSRIAPIATWKKVVTTSLHDSSDEVRECAKRAAFIGGWFAQSGSSASVLALAGVRP